MLANFDTAEAAAAGRGRKTHLARVDLLAAEGIFVGTHVGGVGAVPVVLVVRVRCRAGDFEVRRRFVRLRQNY